MIWRIEIKDKPGVFDAAGESVLKDIEDLRISSVRSVSVVQVMILEGDLSGDQITRICRELFVDPVTQDFSTTNQPPLAVEERGRKVVEIAYNPGVMDPVEASTIKAVRDMGIDGIRAVRTARKYLMGGEPTVKELEFITTKVLMNKLIQHAVTDPAASFKSLSLDAKVSSRFDVALVPLSKAGDRELKELSHRGQLFLNLDEMKTIQKHFKDLGRDPTDCELETIAQTWSEHCNHKTFRGNIRYTVKSKGKVTTRRINNLLKSTIVKATKTLDKPWCVSVFHDNAGIIKFDDRFDVCFKVETHNHPSALEPFGGANTGVGGVIRDILGTGLAAKPICNTDIFCFASPDFPYEKLPAGTLHPKRVMKGVVSGVRDYGNKMGIPTINGAILFDDRFVGNPLVFCGDVGLIPRGKETKAACKGDLVVVVGGRTGRDGIHGATFSSGELTEDSEVVSSGAVQIGNPIEEKKVLDVLIQARDEDLYSAITDCGAGGLSSAVGEMGQELGARVDLDKVPLKYRGLRYTEIWISESQERMVLAVPSSKIKRFLEIFAAENVEATVIGEYPGTGRLELFYDGCQVCDLDMNFLHDGVPRITKEARFTVPTEKDEKFSAPADLTDVLLDALAHYNVASKETVIRQYDHEVQGTSVIKPLMGRTWDGPSDASVVRPRLDSLKGVAVSNGINVRFGMIDPYWMAASCIDEAIRQIVAVGGPIERIALLDNFCWGNPDKPDRLGGLVRAAEGCCTFATAFGTPFISGKDSLYNEYMERGVSLAIPGTILISAIGIIDDVNTLVTMDLKKPGNLIYVVGETSDELGGSIFLDTLGQLGSRVPKVNVPKAVKAYRAFHAAVKKGLVASAHDCSEGGLAVALAEMAFAGGCGITAFVKDVPYTGKRKRDDIILFSESNSRLIVEVPAADRKAFEKAMQGVPVARIGTVEASPEFIVYGLKDGVCINAYINDLKETWKKPLRF